MRNIQRDYKELPGFAKGYQNRPTLECIEAYAAKRRIVSHRAGKAFWALVDAGEIKVYTANGCKYIK